MDDEDLYKEILLDHSRTPRNYRTLESATHHAEGVNPLCGDEVEIQLQIEGDTIQAVAFQGSGCTISQASASMLTQLLTGQKLQDLPTLVSSFRDWIMTRDDCDCPEQLGDFQALGGVRNYPVRVKCALLAWATLERALKEG